MGALRRISHRVSRARGRRAALVTGGVVVAVGGVVACDPAGLSSASVAYTTDQTVTRELDRRDADVRWLTCTASFGDSGRSASATGNTVASVDCEGKTDGGQDITVDGRVTRVVNGACVRGDLTAEVDGKQWFHVKGLGNCDAASAPPASRPSPHAPAPTVTVTRTIWCPDDPHCRPVEGK
ncbi:hypothetical protein [Streptomyces lancefieldiae]|uniref:Lipoprotein n=1 Tax=Streptomyces lancefieldiae TaxID=3075520 RepID=A0ABU3AUE7_9ACTN|nr:hypothetical protein [Streptomyces sp. DSM 40712]MDT0612451.1 hypothetical protein [Streptomyces sp. DSM 40712]